jgi:hypothetical protein
MVRFWGGAEGEVDGAAETRGKYEGTRGRGDEFSLLCFLLVSSLVGLLPVRFVFFCFVFSMGP